MVKDMRILHICLTGPYTDNFNYQENMLSKFQVENGHDVYLIASQWEWGKDGKIKKHIGSDQYKNTDNVSVIRLHIAGDKDVLYRYKKYLGLYESIQNIKPDIIFIHNLQFFDIRIIVKYAKQNKVTIYADNHADFSNSARSKVAVCFYKTVWRHMAHMLEPYTTKFYGVLPARVDFLVNIYGLPRNKCELLVMGADDQEVARACTTENRNRVRDKLGIDKNDFVLATGGKIDKWKSQTLLLMSAVRKINDARLKLLIFGPVAEEIKDDFYKLFDPNTMIYVSWANTQESYDYFAISNLVVFPGRHSVYWEQVAGMGKPMICKYWAGISHLDVGGNLIYIKEDSANAIKTIIENVVSNKDLYKKMETIANGKGRKKFSYREISKRSIEETKQ